MAGVLFGLGTGYIAGLAALIASRGDGEPSIGAALMVGLFGGIAVGVISCAGAREYVGDDSDYRGAMFAFERNDVLLPIVGAGGILAGLGTGAASKMGFAITFGGVLLWMQLKGAKTHLQGERSDGVRVNWPLAVGGFGAVLATLGFAARLVGVTFASWLLVVFIVGLAASVMWRRHRTKDRRALEGTQPEAWGTTVGRSSEWSAGGNLGGDGGDG